MIDLSQLPDLPGVYLMKDDSDTVIYVGKAISLKKRVRQYFQSPKHQTPKTRTLVKNIADLEYIVTGSEVEALILEANLIKKYKPRYNVLLKDDKRYPYIKVTINARYPRVFLVRRRFMDDALYFGPYVNGRAVRQILDLISRIFMLRRCRKSIDGKKSRPCLNFHIGLCLGPCSGAISEENYRERVMAVVRFLKGDTSPLIAQLEKRMEEFSNEQEYESAGVVRDQIQAVKVLSQQQVITTGMDDRDVIAAVSDGEVVYVQLFYVRDGSLVGRADFSLTLGQSGTDVPEAMYQFIMQYYQDSPVPPEILVQHEIPDSELIIQWLSRRSGRDVRIHVPSRGDKKKILDMAARNAEMSMRMAHIKKKPHESANEALEQLKEKLLLSSLPLRIEGFDISNISGSDAVGSMVVFESGNPSSSKYRQYNIRTVDGIDDFAMMSEVVERRYSRLLKENAPLPDLILIDGGPGQVGAAKGSLDSLGLDIPLIGLAKRFEHIIMPDGRVIILPKTSPGLKLLMRVRDEAHRFAVSSHRRRRTSRLTHSKLDTIPGIGSVKKRALINHFGSVDKIRDASVGEIMQVEGISEKLAKKIKSHLWE